SSSGVLNVEIGGLTVGTQYDRLSVMGTATLGGTLNVTLINGYTPTSGDSFTPVSYMMRSGTFATVTGLSQGGVSFTPSYGMMGYTLLASADEEPSTEMPFIPERDGAGAAPEVVPAVAEP